jgi:hypothetical protein
VLTRALDTKSFVTNPTGNLQPSSRSPFPGGRCRRRILAEKRPVGNHPIDHSASAPPRAEERLRKPGLSGDSPSSSLLSFSVSCFPSDPLLSSLYATSPNAPADDIPRGSAHINHQLARQRDFTHARAAQDGGRKGVVWRVSGAPRVARRCGEAQAGVDNVGVPSLSPSAAKGTPANGSSAIFFNPRAANVRRLHQMPTPQDQVRRPTPDLRKLRQEGAGVCL